MDQKLPIVEAERPHLKYFLPALFFLGALFLRLWHLGKQSLWMDEAFSFWVASHPIREILRILETDTHPPLFYSLLHFWASTGTQESHLRLPFACMGALNALLIYVVGARSFSKLTAVLTSLMWSVSFMALYSETQVRMYPMAVCFSLLAVISLIEAVKKPAMWKWGVYFVWASVSIYTHIYTVLLIFAHLAFLAIQKKGRELIWISLGLSLVFLPWSSQFIRQGLNIMSGSKMPPQEVEIFSLAQLLGVYYLFQENLLALLLSSLLGIIVAVFGLFLFLQSERKEKWLFFLLLAIPSLAIFGVGLVTHQHIFFFRYIILFAPYFFLFVGFALTRLPRIVSIPLLTAYVVVNLGLWFLFVNGPAYERQSWRDTSTFLATDLREGDTVVIETFMSTFPLWYYLQDYFEIRYFPGQFLFQMVPKKKILFVPLNGKTSDSSVVNISKTSARQWLILCQEWSSDPSEHVALWFFLNGQQLSFQKFRSLDRDNHVRVFLFASAKGR